MKKVEPQDLDRVMKAIRELRKYALQTNVDPWTFRQALIITLEIDTDAAIRRGVKEEDLDAFDKLVKVDVKAWMKGLKPQ